MDFVLSPEQNDFRQSVRQFVEKLSPLSKVRQVVATAPGYDGDLWSRMSRELGLPSLLIPEEYDGAGATMIEVAIAMEELGRGVVPCPLFATVALGVVPILIGASEERKKELLPEIAAGTRTVTTAVNESGNAASFGGVRMRAMQDGEAVTLTGSKNQVIDGHTADTLLVLALPPGDSVEPELYLVEGDAAGLTRTRVDTLDITRPMATLVFEAVTAVPLSDANGAAGSRHAFDVARTLLAAEIVGGIEGALSMSVEYAKIRHQFNRPIGSFQSIKHRCAEMAIELDSARAITLYAAYLAAAEDRPELAQAAPMALATAIAGFDLAASSNVQIHGGIGFTWEHDAHLYYRRAKADSVLLGSIRDQWFDVADRIGI
jgi:alkylation response protein AidB-like acyl-CoA dehydrogenase